MNHIKLKNEFKINKISFKKLSTFCYYKLFIHCLKTKIKHKINWTNNSTKNTILRVF
jgi:hypothetical protein